MLWFAAATGGVIAFGEHSPARPAFSLALFLGLLLVAGSTVNCSCGSWR
jgi:hypothetical protein